MRLVKQVARIEGAAAARRARQDGPARIQIVWTAGDERLPDAALVSGAYVAVDLVLGACAADEPCELCLRACVGKVRERLTTRLDDLGQVRLSTGDLVGRITCIDGSLLTWEPFD